MNIIYGIPNTKTQNQTDEHIQVKRVLRLHAFLLMYYSYYHKIIKIYVLQFFYFQLVLRTSSTCYGASINTLEKCKKKSV